MQINGVVVGNLTPAKIKQVLGDYRAGKAADYRDLPYSTNDYRTYKQSPHEMVLLDNVGVIDPTRSSMITWPRAATRPRKKR